MPRFIGEIDAKHRGSKCGCECPNCRLPLIAVNAARDKVLRRPHFRHPPDAQRNECTLLAARAAAVRLLAEEGIIELPRRRRSANAKGLSGALQEAWVEAPAQKVRVANIDFRDCAFAMLELDDGRKLRVALRGAIKEELSQAGGDTSESILVPTITIDVDASVAGMDYSGIRERLRLLPISICWRSHWDDEKLLTDAECRARQQAIEALDWLPDDIELPEGLSPSLQRESLLHHEVKRILESTGQITVPEMKVLEELRTAGHPTLRRHWSADKQVLLLTNTCLEYRMKPLIPDVVTHARAADGHLFNPLLIEVTVSNRIHDERKERIRGQGFAALEIDLSGAGGRITRLELHRLVVEEISIKRWICLPHLDRMRVGFQQEMMAEREAQLEAARIAEKKRKHLREMSLDEVAVRYLAAVEQLLTEQALPPPRQLAALEDGGTSESTLHAWHRRPELEAARARAAEWVNEMKGRGYPEAGDEALLGHHCILARLLSIRLNRGVGYALGNATQVLNAIQQSQPGNRHDWTLYLIAAKAYLPNLADDDRIAKWFGTWRDKVVTAVKRNEYQYMRSPKYDRLLSLLFPEMAHGLTNPFGKRAAALMASNNNSKFGYQGRRSRHEPMNPYEDTRSWYLQGDELQAWKRDNPEAALVWEAGLKEQGIA